MSETNKSACDCNGAVIFWTVFGISVFALVTLIALELSGSDVVYEDERAIARLESLKALEKTEEERISSYGWANEEKTRVYIPLEIAMKEAVVKLKSEGVRSAEEITAPPTPTLVKPPVSE